jgi:signal transduction histidine kinase/ActR/RegA family two-component response regulator
MASSGWQQPWVADMVRRWPGEVVAYLQQWVLSRRLPGFLVTDPQVRLVSTGGELAHFGLGDLRQGESPLTEAYFLQGLLPIDGSLSVLYRIETTPGIFADIHMFHIAEGDCVLLLDSSSEVAERSQIEQALRRTEEQLRQSEKMEALGRLVGGVAHDFNNLLTVILGYSHVLMDAPIETKYRTAAVEIKGAANKAADMTEHLLSFSRRQARHLEVVDLNALISRLHSLLRRLIREDIVLHIKADPTLPFVEADPGQIEQVLMNLVTNARDAMPGGGGLEVGTANVEVDEDYLSSHPNSRLHRGPHAQLWVQDTGYGMDAETMTRAFEPFFTSKAPRHGTGLGLAIVYGIIHQSNGDIVLTSRVGSGTRVEILLPAVAKAPSEAQAAKDERLARGSETVLLVEDESAVRRLVREVLTQLGYKVLESADPEAALALCNRHEGRIDLLITDFIMPQMNGGELAARILAIHPETQVLYMSGYAQESHFTGVTDFRDCVFLSKPFTPRTLADRVREALGRRARGR